MSSTHGDDVLARFQRGETCLVLAVDADHDDEVVVFPEALPNDERAAFRERTSRSLRCIVPTCRGPLTAHFRSAKRSGFAHFKDTAHLCDGESLAHELAKYEFAAWVEDLYHGAVTAHVEQPSIDRSRRPDVTLWHRETGERVAVEIQYSAMSVEAMQGRLADHRSDGYVAEIWLLGHIGANAPHGRRRGVRINQLARGLVDAGVTPVWFHPTTREVLTAWSSPDEYGPRSLCGTSTELYEVVELSRCRFERGEFMTPAIERLREAATAREAARREAAARAAARAAREQDRLARAARELEQARARRTASWLASQERAWLLARDGDRLPPYLFEVGPGDEELADRLDVLVPHWKTLVYREMARADEAAVTWQDVCRAAARRQGHDLKKPHWDVLRTASRRIAVDGLVIGRWQGKEFVTDRRRLALQSMPRGDVPTPRAPVDQVASVSVEALDREALECPSVALPPLEIEDHNQTPATPDRPERIEPVVPQPSPPVLVAPVAAQGRARRGFLRRIFRR